MKTNYYVRWLRHWPSLTPKMKNTLTTVFLSLITMMSFSLYAQQHTFPVVPGPINVVAGSPSTVSINDAGNTAAAPSALYDSFEITVDWTAGAGNPWSSEAEMEVVIAAGSTVIDPPSNGSGNPSNDPATLTFSDDFAGIYDPATDGTLDLFLDQSFGGSSADWSNITVTLFEAPTCITPLNLAVNNITTSTADLSWDAEPSATTGFDYVLITDGSTPDGTTMPTGSVGSGMNMANLTGLQAATAYDAYVRSDCGGGDLSEWSAVAEFDTPCTTVTMLPYNEDFENAGNIPLCFTNSSSTSRIWEFDDSPTFGNTYTDNTTGSGFFAFVDASTATTTTDATLTTPSIDVSSLTTPGLSFFVYHFNADVPDPSNEITVEVWDGSAWNQVYFDDNGDVDAWEEIIIDLSTLTITGPIQARFIVNTDVGQNFNNDIAIDDISVDEAPTCFKPGNLAVASVTTTTADLSWDDVASETDGYDYVLIEDGSTPDGTTTPTGSVAAGVTTANLTLLDPNKFYEAYVRSNCGGGDLSDWSTALSFTTLCSTFTAPYSENFDGVATPGIPNCWSVAGNSAGEVETDDSHFGLDDATSAPNFIKFGDVDLLDGDEAILVSPQFSDIGSYDKRIRFQAAFEDGDANSHKLYVGVMSDPADATTFVELEVITSTLDETFSEFTVNLTDSGLIGASQYIAIAAGSDADFDELGIDDFVYEEIPSCLTPTNLAVSSVTTTTAELSWDPETTATGGFDYVLITDGSTPDGTTTPTGSVGAGVTTANLTALSTGTAYEAYVRSDCGGSNSNWSAALSFDTVPDFCGGDLFYDNGGPGADYASNSNETITISPSNPGDVVSVEFTIFDTEINWDGLQIYDGPDATAPIFDSGFVNPGFGPLIDGTWTGDNTEPSNAEGVTFVSTHPTGSLTFVFTSDGGINEAGWEAIVTCGPPPSCPAPTGLSASNVTDSTVDLSWNEVTEALDGYDLVLITDGSIPDGTTTPSVSTPAAAGSTTTSGGITGLAPETAYDVYIRSVCDAAGPDVSDWSAAVSFTTLAVPPANDDLCDAIALTVDATSTFDAYTNAGATAQTDEPIPACFNAGINGSVWFTFVAPPSGLVEVTTDIPGGVLDDTEIAVYEAPTDCNDLTTLGAELGCEQDIGGGNFLSSIDLTGLTAGDTYYVQVDQWGTATAGTFGIEVRDNEPTPMAAAPDPTENPADVISMYSGVYSDVPVDTWLTPWSSAQQSEIQVQGNDTRLYTNLDFAGIETMANPIDASGMDYIHIDVWSPNATTFRVKLVDLGGSAVEGEIAFSIPQGQWESLKIPLDDFADAALVTDPANLLTVRNSLQQLIISALPAGAATVYVDNVYFSKDPEFAQAQIIHNSADPAANLVDIYVNGNLEFPDVAFRTATPFVQLPAGSPIDIDIALAGSTSVADSQFNLNTTLAVDENYVVVASGVLDPNQFDSSVNTPIDFNLEVFAGAQQTSTNPGETSVLVHHGSTDAPTVDIVETSVPLGIVADDISYPEFQGYATVPVADYVINVESADNSQVVASYEANLATLGTADAALTVLASGFLNPAANQNGPAFGLWAALPTGGALLELPLIPPTPMTAAPDPTEDPADVTSLYSGVYTDVPVDTWLTVWSSAQLADIQIQGNDTKLYTDLDFAGIETVSNPIDASGMDFFHIDVWSPNATTFRVKLVDLGNGAVEGEIAFSIPQEQWVSLQVDLEDFADPALVTDPANLLTVRNSIQQLIISGLPAGAVTAYVDNVYFSSDNSVSTEQFDSSNFSFYPNPAQNILNLQTTNQVEEVKVFNMLGQEVMTETPNTVSPSLNVEALQVGTYIMNVTIDGSSANFRFIKE